MKSYLVFDEEPYKGKTRFFLVQAAKTGDALGVIRWFGRWRQYTFRPAAETVFSRGCLEDINAKITELMQERRRP